jgi:hypothetical protein
MCKTQLYALSCGAADQAARTCSRLLRFTCEESARARLHCAFSDTTGETILDNGLTRAGSEVGPVDFSYGPFGVRYI